MNRAAADATAPHAVILFDGVCNLYTWTVQFILPRDPRGYFRFASLQSPFGQQIIKSFPSLQATPDSVVLVENNHLYFKSEAALRITRNLSGIWSLARVFEVVPQPLRDGVYDWIAMHRYQIFGKRQTCL